MSGSDRKQATGFPHPTIVGGRPPEEERELPPVPTGLQKLLRLATVDESFRRQLLSRRAALADAAGIRLSASERAILQAIPEAQIATMVDSLPTPTPDRRDFLRQSASSAVLLLGGAALGVGAEACRPSCNPIVTCGGAAPDPPPVRPDLGGHARPAGIRPDQVPKPPGAEPEPGRPTHRETEREGGAAPDEPPPRPEHDETQSKGGAAPDEPPPRPSRPNATRGIRPRRPDAGPVRPRRRPPSKGVTADVPRNPFDEEE